MISRRHLLVLSIVAVVILFAGIWLGNRSNRSERPKSAGTRVLPALSGKLNDINEIRIVTGGETPFVTLKRAGSAEQKDGWHVAERGGYPADFTKVRELLLKLSDLEVVEEKTSDSESYSALGVEDVKDAKATGKRIDLRGIIPPISLILGKRIALSSNYVRLADSKRSLLAKPPIYVYDGPPIWLDRSLLDLPEADIQEVRLSNTGKTDYVVTRASRDQNDFAVPKLPKGRKLTSAGAPSSIASALANFGLDDVRPLEKGEDWSKGAKSEYRFFDGTVITVMGRTITAEKKDEKRDGENSISTASDNSDKGDKHWVRFAVSFDQSLHQQFKPKPAADKDSKDTGNEEDVDRPVAADKLPDSSMPTVVPDQKAAAADAPKTADELRTEAQKLNERLKAWVYEIPSYKYENLFKPFDELLEN